MKQTMNGKYVKLLVMAASSTTLALGVVIGATNYQGSELKVFAEAGDPYSLPIGGFENGSGQGVINTKLGNPIEFDHSGYSSTSEGWTLASEGYIQNIVTISGLESISFTVESIDADISVFYGWDKPNGEPYLAAVKRFYDVTGAINFNFENSNPNYFMIRNNTSTSVEFEDAKVTYSCQIGDTPDNYLVRDLNMLCSFEDYDPVREGEKKFSKCKQSVTSFSIPAMDGNGNFVTAIGDDAFEGCTSITNVVIPSTIESIGEWAFFECELESVFVPGSVKEIGLCAFFDCDQMESLVLEEGVEVLMDAAFENCDNLVDVILPHSIREINIDNFNECAAIEHIYYCGDEKEWVALTETIGFDGPEERVCYYSEVDPELDYANHWRYLDGVPTTWDK